ncbi:hypothetical protein GobsT_50820 [Gemmata obscuriglobus]|uniref:Uncharacterized protein n=1 Tax=Gemmata obscuriglobus TaxID=114 RepID=A0A2Z3GZU7_9BACT|nr:hypothetical protein [Gemmata obscuriglobus]AWM37017.1 hypothetical protein C1280_08290 [Gemmata obscuriglobus]QEG30278.1 hypothetical protein GobsT_50820 [Gemmata obscuriglobus]VTS09602.1 unnamed protein product [Gemmata obscuriglobus UQM 2246]
MATLTVQTSTFAGLNHTSAAASTADNFANDGRTFLLFTNANASARTLTIAANATSRPGFGSIATPATVVTLPGSATNGGLAVVGPFPTERFNDITTGRVSYTLDVATGMTVAAVKLASYL